MRTRRTAVAAILALGCLAPLAAAGEITLPFDAHRSSLTFTIQRPGEAIDGTAQRFEGEVTFNPNDLSQGGSVVLRVQAVSLETGNRLRDRKMRGTHLEAERFPEIVFRSRSIQVGVEKPGAGGRAALVEGTLGLHGVERDIVVPVVIRYDNGILTAEGSVDLSYTDYGIPIPRFLWLVMDDTIKVRFRIVARPAA